MIYTKLWNEIWSNVPFVSSPFFCLPPVAVLSRQPTKSTNMSYGVSTLFQPSPRYLGAVLLMLFYLSMAKGIQKITWLRNSMFWLKQLRMKMICTISLSGLFSMKIQRPLKKGSVSIKDIYILNRTILEHNRKRDYSRNFGRFPGEPQVEPNYEIKRLGIFL